jgi:hypothetical protein
LWQDAFKNWPLPPIAGWRNWYKRVLADNSAKTKTWDSLRIAQCLELSLAETPKNEDLLIAACHFRSNGVNAFLFGHGPMSPTLADVYMITGLDISGSVYPLGLQRLHKADRGEIRKRIQIIYPESHERWPSE